MGCISLVTQLDDTVFQLMSSTASSNSNLSLNPAYQHIKSYHVEICRRKNKFNQVKLQKKSILKVAAIFVFSCVVLFFSLKICFCFFCRTPYSKQLQNIVFL